MARYSFQGTFRDGQGNIIEDGTISVFLAGTTTAATIYTTDVIVTSTSSVTSDEKGYFIFYIDNTDYGTSQLFDVVLSKTGYDSQTYSDISIFNIPTPNIEYLSSYASFAAAISTIGADEVTLIIDEAGAVSVDTTTPATLHIQASKSGVLTIATGKTLTINGSFSSGLYQTFSCVGTGAVVFGSQSVACVYPQWFGVVGDGVTDDSDALIAACASVTSIYGKVSIPAGTIIRITKNISIGNVAIEGEGAGGIVGPKIFVDFDGTGLTANASVKTVVRNIAFFGKLPFDYTMHVTTNKIGLYIAESHNYIVENCWFSHFNTGLKVYGGSYYGAIEKNKFRMSDIGVHLLGHTMYVVSGANIIYNQFDGWPASQGGPGTTIGIKLEGLSTSALSCTKIIGNGIENLNQGISFSFIYDSAFLHNWFEDNTVHINETGTGAGSYGNIVQGGTLSDPSQTQVAITGISQAAQAIVTADVTGLTNGDIILITDVVGMTQVNGNSYKVANIGVGTFELQTIYGVAVDSSAYTAYSSGGNYMIKRIVFYRPHWNYILAPTQTGTFHGLPMSMGPNGNLRLGYMDYADQMIETSGLGLAYGNDRIEFQSEDPTVQGYGWKIETRTTAGVTYFEIFKRKTAKVWTKIFSVNNSGAIIWSDSTGTTMANLSVAGFNPPTVASASALAGRIFIDTADGVLKFKDSASVVHDLY